MGLETEMGAARKRSNTTPLASVSDNQPLSLPYTLHHDHSPTLPNVPTHPTLSSLIILSLDSSGVLVPLQESSAVLIAAPEEADAEMETQLQLQAVSSPPRVRDPQAARRMVGHALRTRHPSLVKNATLSLVAVGGGVGAGMD